MEDVCTLMVHCFQCVIKIILSLCTAHAIFIIAHMHTVLYLSRNNVNEQVLYTPMADDDIIPDHATKPVRNSESVLLYGCE
jgi:hypothetical protein